MRLTLKKAIWISKELWTWLAETGKEKHEWPGWGEYGKMGLDCPLCEYASEDRFKPTCEPCPYHQKYKRCTPLLPPRNRKEKTLYWRWAGAKTPKTRKKYAALFLAQLEKLK